jgi:hypothetical protein
MENFSHLSFQPLPTMNEICFLSLSHFGHISSEYLVIITNILLFIKINRERKNSILRSFSSKSKKKEINNNDVNDIENTSPEKDEDNNGSTTSSTKRSSNRKFYNNNNSNNPSPIISITDNEKYDCCFNF